MAIAYAFRLPSHTIFSSLLVRLRFKYGLAAIITPTKSGILGTWSTTCPRPLRMASTAPTTAVLALARHPSARLHGSSTDYRPLRPSELSLTLSNEIHSSASDFCVWAPRKFQSSWHYDTLTLSTILYLAYFGTVGDTERVNIAYCTKSGRGARTIPNGALKGVHFVKTPEYVQVTGVGDFTKINIPKGDSGGELDNRGADGMFFLLLSFFDTAIDRCFVFHRQGQPK